MEHQKPENHALSRDGKEDAGHEEDVEAAGDERPSGLSRESSVASDVAKHVKKDGSSESSTGEEGNENGNASSCEGGDGKEFRVPLRLTKSGRRRATPFPIKLMKVLSERENSDIAAWTASGKAFMIFQPKLFCAKVLPDEFKSAKFSSFTRKLHRWGFMRHYRGEDAGAFYHKNFQKGRLDLVEKMSCYKPLAVSAAASTKQDDRSSPAEPPDHSQPLDSNPVGAAPANSPAALTLEDRGSSTTEGRAGAGIDDLNCVGVQQQHFGRQLRQAVQQPPGQQIGALVDSQHDLDAAIEYEVARRLRERIHEAALSRQSTLTLAAQQQHQSTPGFDPCALMFPMRPSAAVGIPSFTNMSAPVQPMHGPLFAQQYRGLPFFDHPAAWANPFAQFGAMQHFAMLNQAPSAQLNMMQGRNPSAGGSSEYPNSNMTNFKTS